MAEELLKGKELWEELEGKKEEVRETVEVGLGDTRGEVTVVFRDFDEVQEVFDEYGEMLPNKPKITIPIKGGGKKNIEVPNEQEEYKEFNNHPEAKEKIKEWEKECKPYEKERIYRMAYLFMKEDERPAEDSEKGVEILKKCLPYADAVKLSNTGMRLNNLGDRLGEQGEDSLPTVTPQES
ncbi:MAG: hypothetical protein ACOC5T_01140 [Elusimicrobiota bacterium]